MSNEIKLNESVFVSEAECGVCLNKVLAVNLELTTLPFGGQFWACDECRKELREQNGN